MHSFFAFELSSTSGTVLLLLGLMIVTGTLLLRSWKYFNESKRRSQESIGLLQTRKNASEKTTARRDPPPRGSGGKAAAGKGPTAATRKQLGKTHDMVARWEIDMHDLARELTGQIDSKMSLLQTLLAEGQRVADRLDHSIDRFVRVTSSLQSVSTSETEEETGGKDSPRSENANEKPSNSSAPEPRKPELPQFDFSRELREFDRLASTLREEVGMARPKEDQEVAGAVDHAEEGFAAEKEESSSAEFTGEQLSREASAPHSGPLRSGHETPSRRNDLRDHIYMLADYGFSLPEIASRVGRPAGEVELVLSLRQTCGKET